MLHYGDLTDATNLIRIVQQVQPDEIYNLGAQSHVQVSFETPEYTANADAHGHAAPAGGDPHPGAGEEDALLPGLHLASCTARCRRRRRRRPRPSIRARPTRVAKLYAYWITVNYREAYGMYACNGILFNHESPAARRDLRHPQDHPRAGAHRAGPAGLPVPGQPGRPARLGPCPRLRRDAVADAAAGRGRGLRDRHRRAALGARVRRAAPPASSASRSTGRAQGEDERGVVRKAPAESRDEGRAVHRRASTRATSGRPRSRRCWATRARRARSWAGCRPPPSRSWSRRWCRPIFRAPERDALVTEAGYQGAQES